MISTGDTRNLVNTLLTEPSNEPKDLKESLRAFPVRLSTAQLCDACVRLGVPVRVAPFGISSLKPRTPIAGRALPVRHYGSVDIFLEAIEQSEKGDIVVVDNGNRTDEGCIGDLTVLEMKSAGVTGTVIWGLHRDVAGLLDIALPVFSYGSYPAGPRRPRRRGRDALTSARFGQVLVTRKDVVFGDDDGVLFLTDHMVSEVFRVAEEIAEREKAQAAAARAGQTLRSQLRFDEYLAARNRDSSYSFRKHLRLIGGSIEE